VDIICQPVPVTSKGGAFLSHLLESPYFQLHLYVLQLFYVYKRKYLVVV